MSKERVSVYLDDLVHTTLSGHLARITGGRGSVADLIDHVATQAYQRIGGRDDAADAFPRDGAIAAADALERIQDPRGGLLGREMGPYLAEWRKVAGALPWGERAPAAAHAVGLALHAEELDLWRRRHEVHAWQGATLPSATVEREPEEARDVLRAMLKELRAKADQRLHPEPQAFRGRRDIGLPLFRRDRLDITWLDQKPSPISLSLDREAYDFLTALLPDTFLATFEWVVTRTLEQRDRHHVIEPELAFIERGPALLASPGLDHLADALRQAFVPPTHPEIDGTYIHPNFRLGPDASLVDMLDVTESTFDPAALAVQDMAPTIAYDEVSPLDVFTAILARRVGLLDDGWSGEPSVIRQGLQGAFQAHYGITELTPTWENALRVLQKRPAVDLAPAVFNNAVEFHLWKLFEAYVQHITGQPLTADRMATLACVPYPVRSALEVFGGARVEKQGSRWVFSKSRQVVLELDHADALAAGDLLGRVVDTSPRAATGENSLADLQLVLLAQDGSPMLTDLSGLGELAFGSVSGARSLPRTLNVDAGPHIIKLALDARRRTDSEAAARREVAETLLAEATVA